jgi:predicted acetyltransferase
VTVETRLVPEADWRASRALGGEAFGHGGRPPTEADDARWKHGFDHSVTVGGYDGGTLVSQVRIKPYAQWFGGRAVPMGGLASVAVAAAHQGRGVARATVAAALPVLRERGLVVSALYPTTATLYRGAGWEIAGDYTWVDVPGALLRALGPVDGVTLRAGTADDAGAVLAAYRTVCRETNGMLDREGPFFDPGGMLTFDSFVVAEGPGGVEGYALAERRHSGHEVEVTAWDVVGTTPAAERAVWFALGAGASTAKRVRAKAVAEPLGLLLGEPEVTLHEHLRWMLRVVDAPAAVAVRGWPPGVAAAVDLDLADPQVPDNAGRWRLAVEGGAGTLTRGGDGTVALDAGAFASWWSGYADPRTLRRLGRLRCADERALDTLAVLTAGPRPRMLDYF